ncbi:AraC family transcriptional regulator, partial [Trinickia terrae]
MFSTIYFAASSALASDDIPLDVAAKIFKGQFIEASHCAAQLADIDAGHTPGYAHLQIYGDLEL